ncbi:MAG: hypothetical protein J2P47_11555 [Acetobacteraceae bacterium]|nr:hypothetical protein [Acetobacteraceae bacterium]
MRRCTTVLAAAGAVAVGGIATSALAEPRDHPHREWREAHRDWHGHGPHGATGYGYGYYPPPPVVYAPPPAYYNAPPVVYGVPGYYP